MIISDSNNLNFLNVQGKITLLNQVYQIVLLIQIKILFKKFMSTHISQNQKDQKSLLNTNQTHKTSSSSLKLKNNQLKIMGQCISQLNTSQNSPLQQNLKLNISQQYLKDIYQFKHSQKTDHHRHKLAHSDGGITCDDPKQIDKLRSVGKQMIKIIGRKILSGQFNLTKISIPLKSCYPKTALFNSIKGYCIFPYFLSTAAKCTDSLQRFKIVLTCLIAQPYFLNMFLKPLNPLLGQTLQASLQDGTKIYVQQISHHPPISYFLIVGPNQSYKFCGHYDVQVNPGLNSLTIKNKGTRKFIFNDGTQIQSSYSKNQFSGTFFGTSRVEDLNKFSVVDKKNLIQCHVQFGKLKKKPTDHFESKITQNGTAVAKIEGTCLGYLNIDGKRYWDGRQLQTLEFIFQKLQKRLPSDWQKRQDLQALQKNELQLGQKYKQQLQQKQRSDAKLRKNHLKQGQKQKQKNK